jgi:phosphoribosylformylglycinamidine cyclo-ligase
MAHFNYEVHLMSYKKSGVDETRAASWVQKIAGLTSANSKNNENKMRSRIGDYAAVFELNPQNWVATACDGVGTKLLWTTMGLASAKDLAQDLLAMNANDVLCVGATPVLFLDYLALGNAKMLDEDEILSEFIAGLQEHCASQEQILAGGETAQMPDLYHDNHFDLAGFSVGFMSPDQYFDVDQVQIGDELWGWQSSGPHANGFSWLRKSFDPQNDKEWIQKHLMPPTKLYVQTMKKFKAALSEKSQLKNLLAAYHITGTGLLNLLRKQPTNSERKIGFDLKYWPEKWPEWLEEMKRRNPQTELKEFYTTFNMGFGFCCLFTAQFAKTQKTWLESQGLVRLGEVTSEECIRIHGLRLTAEDE